MQRAYTLARVHRGAPLALADVPERHGSRRVDGLELQQMTLQRVQGVVLEPAKAAVSKEGKLVKFTGT